MSLVKFDYTPEVFFNEKTRKVEYIYRPLIPIRLAYKHSLGKFPINCLLDSGADKNLFPAQWGQAVGINIKSGKEITHYGIGDKDIKCFRHKVMLLVGAYKFETEADFSFEQSFPLVGRDGFFKHFKKITFQEKERFVQLKH